MRGLILMELLDFAAREWPPAPPSPRYEALAQYDDAEFEAILAQLGAHSGLARDELLRRFGRQLFGRFAALFPVFLAGAESSLDLLANLERRVHEELRALATGIDPPRILCVARGMDWVELEYRSPRRLADLVDGLLAGCAEHYGESLETTRSASADAVRFVVRRSETAVALAR